MLGENFEADPVEVTLRSGETLSRRHEAPRRLPVPYSMHWDGASRLQPHRDAHLEASSGKELHKHDRTLDNTATNCSGGPC
ncbi:MAG: hypothetical protein R3F17_15810 [Planctomycetota bacterium]